MHAFATLHRSIATFVPTGHTRRRELERRSDPAASRARRALGRSGASRARLTRRGHFAVWGRSVPVAVATAPPRPALNSATRRLRRSVFRPIAAARPRSSRPGEARDRRAVLRSTARTESDRSRRSRRRPRRARVECACDRRPAARGLPRRRSTGWCARRHVYLDTTTRSKAYMCIWHVCEQVSRMPRKRIPEAHPRATSAAMPTGAGAGACARTALHAGCR